MSADGFGVDLELRRPPAERPPTHLLGWATKHLVLLDELEPGALRRLLTAAPLSRQAIFAALALSEDELVRRDPVLAHLVRDGRARDILQCVLPHIPEGLLGALARIGGHPLPRASYYVAVTRMYFDPAKQKQVAALRECGRITRYHARERRIFFLITSKNNVDL